MKKRLITEFLNFRQYLWVDEKGKKSRLSAPQYIDYIMTYVQKTINDESTFPTKHGISKHYLKNTRGVMPKILQRFSISIFIPKSSGSL